MEVGDLFETAISAQAQAELAAATRVHRRAQIDEEDQSEQTQQGSVGSTNPPAKSTGANQKSQKVDPRATSLGIQRVAKCMRKSMKCYFCAGVFDVGDLRFEYVHRRDKPPKSIHVTCLSSICLDPNAVQGSVETLETLMGNLNLQDNEQVTACQDALQFLRSSRV